MPPTRTCADCGTPCRGTRCPTHRLARNQQRDKARGSSTQRGYDSQWRKHSKQAIADHLATHGPTCPGWQRPPHTVDPTTFVCDHDAGPMCLPCNSSKAGGWDKHKHPRGGVEP